MTSDAENKMGIEKLIRKELLSFGGYAAAASPETLAGKIGMREQDIIKLDANENPYGPSPRVQKALSKYQQFHIYPDDGQEKLRQLLADYTGMDMKYIVAGGGSNQLIDLLVRLFVAEGDEIINCTPTFGVYSFSTRLVGGKLVEVPRKDDFSLDMKTVKTAINSKTKLIFLANPNNPTGNLTPETEIVELLSTGVPVVVDEAYYEFSGMTVLPLVKTYDNLIVLRTFSKWAGLAGLRVGYGFFPPAIADFMLRIKIPYNVNVAAQVAVNESIKDAAYLMASVQLMVKEREILFQGLKKMKWLQPYPSQANYILCRVSGITATQVHKRLQEKGILVRYFDQPRLQDCIRFSVGKPAHTNALLTALKEIGG
ncbi:MAG: histidinol-phosphate transaminase [Dehalococcoidales bacterium]|nr:histidinol-phosphate transaminase [Dehalococcoidales bacterium]